MTEKDLEIQQLRRENADIRRECDELIRACERRSTEAAYKRGYEARDREIVRCSECELHDNCITEDTFRIARIENPFCCAGRKEGDGEA